MISAKYFVNFLNMMILFFMMKSFNDDDENKKQYVLKGNGSAQLNEISTNDHILKI